METNEEYLGRKHKEIALLNNCLAPLCLSTPRSPNEVIEHKFRLTAALRAQHDFGNWSATETSWSHNKCAAGPFEFRYDYQRADLSVDGPSFYGFGQETKPATIYTGSGMAAITALLLASNHVWGEADILISAGLILRNGRIDPGAMRAICGALS